MGLFDRNPSTGALVSPIGPTTGGGGGGGITWGTPVDADIIPSGPNVRNLGDAPNYFASATIFQLNDTAGVGAIYPDYRQLTDSTGSGAFGWGNSFVEIIANNGGSAAAQMRFTASNNTNYIAVKAPNTVSPNWTLTLPSNDGASGQVLTTDGSGVTSWTTPGGGITWSTPIDANITLDTNNLYTIGTDSVRFKNIQTNGLYATDGGTITTTGIGCLVSGRIRSGFTWALSADGTRALVGSSTNGGGTITYNISGVGSTVMGSISGNGTFTKNISGQGCLVSGFHGNGSVTLNGTSHVFGYWDGPTISVGGSNNGSTIIGASISGTMSISGVGLNGNTLIGFANSGTLQTTAGQGVLARGYAVSSGSITGSNDGAFASGYATGSGSTITASGPGSHALGMTSAGGDILSSASGSLAFGFAQGTLTSSGSGTLAFGLVAAGGTIQATTNAAFAGGHASTSGSSINAQTNAGIAFGFVNSTFAITTSGGASLALGRTSTGSILATGLGSISMGDELSTSGEWAISFGRGHVNNTFLTAVFGRYSVTPTANASTWTATDPLFVIGNGASTASRSNAFEILKDGTVNLFGPGGISFVKTVNTTGLDSNSMFFTTGDSDLNSGTIVFQTGAAGVTRGSIAFDGEEISLSSATGSLVELSGAAGARILSGLGLDIVLASEERILVESNSSRFVFPTTVTPGGTTGNQTINKMSGTVNFAAAATSLVVTCNKCYANSIVFAVVRTNDATAVIKNVVPAAGSFTINLNAAATAETSVGFWVINE